MKIFVNLLLLATAVSGAGEKNLRGLPPSSCTTIQSGLLFASDGVTELETGYDDWGYNYQAHMYSGQYCNYNRPNPPVQSCEPFLIMKWNEAWLSNKDCDNDGKLDRHPGFPTYIGSGAWLTNHMVGDDEDENVNGRSCPWEYFVKIVAAPTDAYKDGGICYSATGDVAYWTGYLGQLRHYSVRLQ